jgi:transposase
LEDIAMLGPGRYEPDITQGITRTEDLPKPVVVRKSRNYKRRCCPMCGHGASRLRSVERTLHDLGDSYSGRPQNVAVHYSQHRCSQCNGYFNANMDDLALPKSHYTHRVVSLAVRLVVEDGLPYRTASWHLWRDHRVFVPWSTIKNWVEAAGKKS